jgi:hypothetical protein
MPLACASGTSCAHASASTISSSALGVRRRLSTITAAAAAPAPASALGPQLSRRPAARHCMRRWLAGAQQQLEPKRTVAAGCAPPGPHGDGSNSDGDGGPMASSSLNIEARGAGAPVGPSPLGRGPGAAGGGSGGAMRRAGGRVFTALGLEPSPELVAISLVYFVQART